MFRRVLLVDDDQALATILSAALTDEGFLVTTARNGVEGLKRFDADGADVVILDVLMPEMDGLDLCRRLRRKSNVPIILLSSRGEEIDRVTGLETGADDYVTKPFSTRELVARLRALERRLFATSPVADASTGHTPPPTPLPLEAGPLRIDAARFEARWRDQRVALTRSEFLVLTALVRHRGQVLARDRLLDLARGEDTTVTDRTVDTFVKRLRKKIRETDPTFDEIETVFGVGYRYKD